MSIYAYKYIQPGKSVSPLGDGRGYLFSRFYWSSNWVYLPSLTLTSLNYLRVNIFTITRKLANAGALRVLGGVLVPAVPRKVLTNLRDYLRRGFENFGRRAGSCRILSSLTITPWFVGEEALKILANMFPGSGFRTMTVITIVCPYVIWSFDIPGLGSYASAKFFLLKPTLSAEPALQILMRSWFSSRGWFCCVNPCPKIGTVIETLTRFPFR